MLLFFYFPKNFAFYIKNIQIKKNINIVKSYFIYILVKRNFVNNNENNLYNLKNIILFICFSLI